jgi:hypothetical protein
MDKRFCLFLLTSLLCSLPGQAQQKSVAEPQINPVTFIVIVTAKSGTPVTDLQQQDFKVFDNGSIRAIQSFRAIGGTKKPARTNPLITVGSTLSASNSDGSGSFPRYEITLNAASAAKANEYHQVEIRVDRPALRVVLERQGYYAQFDGAS